MRLRQRRLAGGAALVLGAVVGACTTSLTLVPSDPIPPANSGDFGVPKDASTDGDANANANVTDGCASPIPDAAPPDCPGTSTLLGLIATHQGQVNLDTRMICGWTNVSDCTGGAERMATEAGALAECQRIWPDSIEQFPFDAASRPALVFNNVNCTGGGEIPGSAIDYHACCGF